METEVIKGIYLLFVSLIILGNIFIMLKYFDEMEISDFIKMHFHMFIELFMATSCYITAIYVLKWLGANF